MDLAKADNEVVAVDDEDVMVVVDEEVFYVSSSWFDEGADSLAVR
jgi:predicted FMN-binding regulatory protein PaiB